MQKPLYPRQLNLNINFILGCKVGDKPLGVTTRYHATQNKNHNKTGKLKKDGYIFYKTDK